MKYSTLAAVTVALQLGGMAAAASAQEPATADGSVAEGFATGSHIVRPGENLRKITEAYLGSQERWELNWSLNPQVSDPHVLLPGQRLRVAVKPGDSVPSARVVSLSGRVEGRPAPIDWTPARADDLVVESDGVRTFEQSSTALRFHDGTSLVMTEDSIVFLKRAGRTLRGIETRSVEIVEGQADLATSGSSESRPEIEFVIGDATASPRPAESGGSEARLRKSPEGTAQLMVYEGESELAAGGATVAVPRGMGASVPEGAPPTPPEPLLPEPTLSAPGPSDSLELGGLDFSWDPVDGARSYTIEICSDAVCQSLVARGTGLGDSRWQPAALPLGDYFWRVTAASESGLDGYPSDARPVSVRPTRAEFEPPTASFQLAGVSVEKAGRRFFNPAVRVVVEVEDASGVAGWEPVIDGRSAGKEALSGGWSTGEHTVGAVAEDRLGNRGETADVTFSVDGEGPTIVWETGGMELLDGWADGGELESPRARGWLTKAARRNAKRARKSRPPVWTLLGWANERLQPSRTVEKPNWIDGLYRSYRGVRLAGGSPRLLLLAPGVDGRSNQLLSLQVDDAMSGVEELTMRMVGSPEEGFRLEATARDRLGNKSRRTWDFDSGADS